MVPHVIDAHTHMFPDDLPARWDWYAAQDECFALLTRQDGNSRVRELFANADEALACADRAGVGTLVMQGWYWRSMPLCRRHNDYMKRLADEHPGRFAAFGCVDVLGRDGALAEGACADGVFADGACAGDVNECPSPQARADAAAAEAERCARMGFAGIGELGPGGQGFALDDPGLYALLETTRALRLPVCFHCGEPVGHAYAGMDRTPLDGFFRLAKQFPGQVFIFAHLGGGLPFYELMPEVRRALRNVYYDLAAMPLLYSMRALRAVIDLAGPERVLYGTDFPLTIYPKKCMEQDLSLFIQDIWDSAGLTPREWDCVMHGNAARILSGEVW